MADYREHVGCIYRLELSHNEKYLVSGGKDADIRVWDVQTGQVLARAKGHTSGTTGFSFAPDDSWFASASFDGTVACWNTTTGTLRHKFEEPVKAGMSMLDVSVSSDGKWVAGGGSGKEARVWIWNAITGEHHRSYNGHKTVPNGGIHHGGIESLRFMPDGRSIISCGADKTMQIWDMDSGKEMHRTTLDEKAWRFTLSPDGRRAVTGHHDGSVRVWMLPQLSK